MANRHVVVVCGNMGHGKDSLCSFMATYTDRFAIRAFADPLKRAVSIFLGVPLEFCYTDTGKNTLVYGQTIRHWLQHFGTEYCRNVVDTSLWVHHMVDYVQSNPWAQVTPDDRPWERRVVIDKAAEVFLIPDGRFRNEIDVLRQKLAGFAKVHAVKIRRPRVEVNLSHSSESEIFNTLDSTFDHVIENDGILSDLALKAVCGLQALGVPLLGDV